MYLLYLHKFMRYICKVYICVTIILDKEGEYCKLIVHAMYAALLPHLQLNVFRPTPQVICKIYFFTGCV